MCTHTQTIMHVRMHTHIQCRAQKKPVHTRIHMQKDPHEGAQLKRAPSHAGWEWV